MNCEEEGKAVDGGGRAPCGASGRGAGWGWDQGGGVKGTNPVRAGSREMEDGVAARFGASSVEVVAASSRIVHPPEGVGDSVAPRMGRPVYAAAALVSERALAIVL